jgi:hypothetical protein
MKRKDRTDLVNAIVAATGGADFRRSELLDPAQRIFDPDDQGRSLGPRGARLGAASWVNVIEAKVVAAQVLGDIDDDLFERARLQHHAMMGHYIERQPGFAQDPDIGAIFPAPTLDWFANEACDQITTTIGFLELARRQGGASGAAAGAASTLN